MNYSAEGNDSVQVKTKNLESQFHTVKVWQSRNVDDFHQI